MAQVGAGGVSFDTERLKTVGKGWLDELFSDEEDSQVLTLLALLVQKYYKSGTKVQVLPLLEDGLPAKPRCRGLV